MVDTRSALKARPARTQQMALEFQSACAPESTARPLEGRFANISDTKATGSTYTPRDIAAYLAARIVEVASPFNGSHISLLDPAIGDGALALALLDAVSAQSGRRVRLVGYETDATASALARKNIEARFPNVDLEIRGYDFLADQVGDKFDIAIANPPYVRTQILGATDSKRLAERYGLEGRVDLYQAFSLELIDRLKPGGTLGLITSNRFLTTKGADAFRSGIGARLDISRIWDLGDTKIFDAAVLPAMMVGRKVEALKPRVTEARFTSIYENRDADGRFVESLATALDETGDVQFRGRRFSIVQGVLHAQPGEVWRPSSVGIEGWLRTVSDHTWKRLGGVGKVRVGIKTTADKVFIRDDWNEMGLDKPELLLPLITHHVGARFKGAAPSRRVLYPHVINGTKRQVADLSRFPKSAAYLEAHREILAGRKYVIAAGRKWYEVWVPQDPALWATPKIVFRDIVERPTFWLDTSGSVVNGDCYWLVAEGGQHLEILWLALAVTNSTFIEAFYDRCFNNKLYAGRRRFMSQYVEKFPLPDPMSTLGRALIEMAKLRFTCEVPSEQARIEREIDDAVWSSFGLSSHSRRSTAFLDSLDRDRVLGY